MPELQDCQGVSAAGLVEAVRGLHGEGWRFVTASCVPRSAGWTVLFHFERDERLCHLRVEVPADGRVPAIDEVYPAAFLVENEMSELQLLPVTDLSIDYGGRLYRDFDGPEGWVHDPAPDDAGPGAAARPGDRRPRR